MKKLFVAGGVAIVLLGAALPAQNAKETPQARDVSPGGFEMTTYYVGFLYKGPKWSAEQTPEVRKTMEGHMAQHPADGRRGQALDRRTVHRRRRVARPVRVSSRLDGRGARANRDRPGGKDRPIPV